MDLRIAPCFHDTGTGGARGHCGALDGWRAELLFDEPERFGRDRRQLFCDLERTRKMMPGKPDDFFVKPDDVAATAAWLAAQPRSAWAFEVEARPFGENW